MNEFKYYDIPSPFPTLARGLFSKEITQNSTEGDEGGGEVKKYQIVVRGYDKFFNIGEVPWTTVYSFDSLTLPSLITLLSGRHSKNVQHLHTHCP